MSCPIDPHGTLPWTPKKVVPLGLGTLLKDTLRGYEAGFILLFLVSAYKVPF